MNKIIERVYLGSLVDAARLRRDNPANISAVLNVCEEPDFLVDLFYKHIPFPDHVPIPFDKFTSCMDWLITEYANKQIILVHCALGISRSPTICSAFLVKLGLLSDIDAAFQVVKNARPEVNPAAATFSSAKEYLTK